MPIVKLGLVEPLTAATIAPALVSTLLLGSHLAAGTPMPKPNISCVDDVAVRCRIPEGLFQGWISGLVCAPKPNTMYAAARLMEVACDALGTMNASASTGPTCSLTLLAKLLPQ